jgi:adenylosuccinate lyase
MNTYDNPLITRYASAIMSEIWSPDKKFKTWRSLWFSLAAVQKELGLSITQNQLDEIESKLGDDIDYETAQKFEAEMQHDVMAHVHNFCKECPIAAPIIHFGATSCFVTDNTDILLMSQSLELITDRLRAVISTLAHFAERHKNLACLGFTHLQPAQPTTVGKRACLWNRDLADDFKDIQYRYRNLSLRGVKGTTGTQASFLKIFKGDRKKVKQLDELFAKRLGFDTYVITGQTYSRKIDCQILDALSGLAQSAHKMATDIRLLASRREMEEPFGKNQIGSSAMAYKRNPMKCERICSLARFVISLQSSTANTLATQWMERTLDDSANRRLVLPQAFLAVDAILMLLEKVVVGLVVHPEMITKNLNTELPFMATENILMAAVIAGKGGRQDLHERIRVYSHEAAEIVKKGGDNDLIDRLKKDDGFKDLDFDSLLNIEEFIGCAPDQVDEFNKSITVSFG